MGMMRIMIRIIINVVAVSVVGKKINKVSYCRKFPSFVAVFHRDDDDDDNGEYDDDDDDGNNDDDGDDDDVSVRSAIHIILI